MKNVDAYVTGTNARFNFRQLEETHTMENIIFNEMKIRGFSVGFNPNESNYIPSLLPYMGVQSEQHKESFSFEEEVSGWK